MIKNNGDCEMIGTTFSIKRSEIPNFVFKQAEEESNLILESIYTEKASLSGNERTKDKIVADTLLGKLGEYFIKSVFHYTDDNAKYHDLISPSGVRTEIKTWRKEYMSTYKTTNEINRLRARKKSRKPWFFSTEAIVISYDSENNLFEIVGVYDI